MAVQLRSGKELEKVTERNDINTEKESPEKEEEMERKKERKSGPEGHPRLKTCSAISTASPEVQDRRAVCKVSENLSEARDQYALY